jgi:nucleoside-diphosphate-sugar epimerase
VNTHATISLAQQAAAAGVKRFIFVSSIGVNGCVTRDKPFSVEDIPNPNSPYTQSKYEAELGLKDISDRTGIEVVIIRPPMVYGPNAPGNFGRMVSWLASGVPLPLGAVTGNRRSFVGLDNLVDLISVCIDHPSARDQIFLVSDGEDMSTTDLICRVSCALGKKPNLLPIPPLFLRFVAAAIGKENIAQRLLDNLQIDFLHTCSKLGWAPPVSVDAGISRSVIGFNRN